MKRARSHQALAGCSAISRTLLAAAVSAVAAPGCMDYGDLVEPIELSTHVTDWRDQVIYQVMIDRFADGDRANNYNVIPSAPARWHGGDWAGLESKLDYLAELGVTALWISPVYRNVETDADVDGYHGYWPQDFTAPNLHFGDILTLRRLIQSAHDRQMLVIFDVVTNHVGQLFYYDINLNGHPDDQVRGSGDVGDSDVIHINEYDPDFDTRGIQAYTSLGEAGPAPIIFTYDPYSNHMPPLPEVLQRGDVYNRRGRTIDFSIEDQLLHGDFPGGLKDLNTTRCDVKQAMVESYARWVELTDADGFRIDTVKHVEREFWRYFTQKVRQRLAAQGKTNFFMFGESFDGNSELVGSFTMTDLPDQAELDRENQCVTDGRPITGDQLDGVFHFPQYYQVIRDVFQNGGATDRIEQLWTDQPNNYGSVPTQLGTGLPPLKTLVNFMDNHDVYRFLFSGAGVDAMHQAIAYLLTRDGIPCIYYGTEQQFSGGNDPANREDMWTSGFDTSNPSFRWIQRLIELRKALPALRRGDATVRWSSERVDNESDAGIFAFERTGGDAGADYALVMMNVHRTKASAPLFEDETMTVGLPAGTVLVDLLSADRRQVTVGAGSTLTLDMAPLSSALLVPVDQVPPGL